jgi:thiamine-phosphate pyrophosphorylase
MMKTMRERIDWRLCFIADSEAAAGSDVLELVAEAVKGGATIIQLRGKNWISRDLLDLGLKAVRLLRPEKVPVIINDRVDIALACEADGVHLGQDDMPIFHARKLLGKNRIIGLSAATVEEAEAAEKSGADYIGAGPVFSTLSKRNLGPLLGLDGLRAIRRKVQIPVLAIGGISMGNAFDVVSAGADGLAVISAITAAPNPKKAATELIETIEKLKNRSR